MLILALIHLTAGGLSIGSKSSYDPGPLSWSQSTWCLSPITLSESNAGASVSITFFFHTFTAVQSGVFCVEFPAAFSQSPVCSAISNFQSDQDNSVTIPNIVLPTSIGAFGPFVVYTAISSTGSILDLSNNFGTIWVFPSYSVASSGLSLSFGSSEVQAQSEIIFTFTLGQSIAAYDYFTISVPSYFSIQNPRCSSRSVSILAGTGQDNSTLGCDISGNLLRVYGNAYDITINNTSTQISVQVGMFTNPSSTVSNSQLQWIMKVVQLGTNQVLQAASFNGPLLSYKNMVINSWAPVVNKSMVAGCNGYMKLLFTLGLNIPLGGSIIFTFTNADISSVAWKSTSDQSASTGTKNFYMLDSKITATCAVTANSGNSVLTCTTTSLATAGPYSLYTLPMFSGTSANVVIYTYDQNSLGLEASSQYSFNYSSSVSLTMGQVRFAPDNSGSFTANTKSSVILYLKFQSPVSLASGDIVKMTLPLGSAVNNDMLIGVISSVKANTLVTAGSSVTNYGGLTLTLNSNPVLSSKTLSITLPVSASSSQYVYIYLSSDNSASSPAFNLPYVSSNLLTNYEFSISITKNNVEYVYAGPLTILPAPLSTATGNLLCTTSYSGLPFAASIVPAFDYSYSGSLFIDIEFSGYGDSLGTGMVIGSQYPVSTSLQNVVFTLQKSAIQLEGLKSVQSASTYSFTFPLGAGPVASNTAVYNIYYLVSGIQYIIMSSNVVFVSNSLGSKPFTTATINTFVGGSSATPSVGSTFSLQFQLTYSSTFTSGYLGIVFPQGYSFSTPSVTLLSDPSKIATLSYLFSNTNVTFPSVFIALSSNFQINSIGSTFVLSNIVAPAGASSASLRFILASSSVTDCVRADYSTPLTLSTSALSFTSALFTPTSILALGPNSLTTTVSATLKLPSSIPAGSAFAVTLAWTLTSLYSYSITGIPTYTFSLTGQTLKFSQISSLQSSSTIVVNVYNVLAPTASASQFQFSSIGFYTDSSLAKAIVLYTGASGVTINSASSKGISRFSTASVFPNGNGLVTDIIYLKFYLDHNLVVGGSVSIASPTGTWALTGDIKKNCFSSIYYSSCTAATGQITLVLAQNYTSPNYIEVLIDQGIVLPSTIGNLASGFTVTTAYAGVTIDQDSSTSPSPLQTLQVVAVPNATLVLNNPVQVVPNNIGELSSYIFNFTVNTSVSLTNTIFISFPRGFDPMLGGKNLFKNSDPNTFYISCNSSTANMSSLLCIVDHWTVAVTGISSLVVKGTSIIIQLNDIRTPAAIPQFSIYVADTSYSILAYNQTLSMSSPVSQGTITIVKSFNVQSPTLRDSSIYQLQIYINAINNGSQIFVTFPVEYNIPRDNSQGVQCSGYGSGGSLIGSCYYSSNTLFISINGTVSKGQLVLINFAVFNPEWGISGIDNLYAINGNTYWTHPLTIGVINNGTITEKTYSSNKAYSGFYNNKALIKINNFSPAGDVNTINLRPGIQLTSIPITVTLPLKALSLYLIPKNSGINQVNLYFASDYNFNMSKDLSSISFSLSCPADSENSINFIEWTVVEQSLNGTLIYSVGAKTKVEVYDTATVNMTVIYPGSSYVLRTNVLGPYVTVISQYPPYSDILLSLSLLNQSMKGVYFYPSSLKFLAGETSKYFQIMIDSNFSKYNTSGPYQYTFSQTGSDVTAFSQLGIYEFSQNEQVSYYTPVIQSLSFTSISKTSVSLSIQVNDTSVVYWEFCDFDMPFSTYKDLSSKIYPLNSSNSSNILLSDQIKSYLLGLNPSQSFNQDWQDYQKQMLIYSKSLCFYSASLVQANALTTLFSPTFLWAQNQYKVQVYAHSTTWNYTYSNASFTTTLIDSPISIALTMTTNNTLSNDYITSSLAQSLGVPKGRLLPISSSRRELLSTGNWVLLVDRSSSTSPGDLYNQIDSGLFSSLLKGNTYSMNSAVVTMNANIPSGSLKTLNSTGSSYLVIGGNTTGTGGICCITESYPLKSYNLTAMQVYLGIDRANENAMSNCTSLQTNWFLVVNGLLTDMTYSVSCVFYSNYSGWPALSGIYTMNGTTIKYDTNFTTSSSVYLAALLSGYLLI